MNRARPSVTRTCHRSSNPLGQPTAFHPVISRAFSITPIPEANSISQAQVTIEGQTIAEQGDHVPRPNRPSGRKRSTVDPNSAMETEDDWTDLLVASDGKLKGEKIRIIYTNLFPTHSQILYNETRSTIEYEFSSAEPLSYLGRLIAAELPDGQVGRVEFKGFGTNSQVRWSDSTDIGDFIKQAAHVRSFTISLYPSSVSSANSEAFKEGPINTLEVSVPTFQDRTVYLRERLRQINKSLIQMGELKTLCDKEAKKGAKRVAFSGLVVILMRLVQNCCLHVVFRLGPVTYLIGHGVLVSGYVYWLIHSREPGYGAILTKTISHRQATLYNSHGFDLERFKEITAEGVRVRNEIQSIAIEYGVEWWEDQKSSNSSANKAVPEVEENEHLERQANKSDQKRLEGESA
ncbi:Coiled-coil domain containing protein 109, C-terminal [Phaffia rhodozyma]|uniref:Calcium uniporter protein, mitochondrial n=1 Tax=Phaffia rhodozyma TaxID=264483 RepID=A0A0F7SGP1_PHARH|nr:Coiled-coil domain containing protein 109, C-terminal [Phaffia rhodozyma]